MKHIVLVILIALGGAAYAQKSCFDHDKVVEMRRSDDRSKASYESNSIEVAKYLTGCDFPEYELFTPAGTKFHISELKGNLVFVNFWFIGCHPCLEEVPEIPRLSQLFQGEKIKFLNITFEEQAVLEKFLAAHPMPGVIQTCQDRNILEHEFCSIFSFPMCLLLDKNGKVISAWTGGGSADEFYQKVKKLIDTNL